MGYAYPIGVSLVEFNKIKKNTEVVIDSVDKFPVPDQFGGIQLEDKQYYIDGTIFTFNHFYPVKDDFSGLPLRSNFVGSSGRIIYLGSGALFRDNPDGSNHLELATQGVSFIGDNSNIMFDIHRCQFIFLDSMLMSNFFDLGTIRNLFSFTGKVHTLFEIQNPLKFKDCTSIRLAIPADQSAVLTGNKTYYQVGGRIGVFNIGALPQVGLVTSDSYVLNIEPTIVTSVINIKDYTMDIPAGDPVTGRLFKPGITSTSGTLLDNGAGYVRLNDVSHGLSNDDQIFILRANPIRNRGFFVELIDADNVDLLADKNGILSFSDAGGGLVTVNTDFIHRISAADTIEITDTTSYNGNYTVSSVTGPKSFTITVAFSGDDTGNYKKFEPFTGSGENVEWHSGSLNQFAPIINAVDNGKELDSITFIAVDGTGAGNTNLTTSWTTINATYAIEPDCNCQRVTIFSNGRIYYEDIKEAETFVRTRMFGKSTNSSGVEIEFTFRKNGTDVLTNSLTKATLFNNDENVLLDVAVVLNPGDYLEPVIRVPAGTATYILNISKTFFGKF